MRGGGSFTNPPKRITVPSGGESSNDPYIIIAGDTTQAGVNFASIIFRTPTLPDDWEYRLQIREAPPPFQAQFELVLWDTSTNDQVSRLITQNWNEAANAIYTVVGPQVTDPEHDQQTYLWSHNYTEIATFEPDGLGSIQIQTGRLIIWGQLQPNSEDLTRLDIGLANVNPTQVTLNDKTLGFKVANIHMLSPPAPAGLTSATPITITGASTTTFVKANANTQVEVFMSGGGYITAGAGASVTFGILISGGIGDFSIVKGSFSSLSNRLQFSGTRLLAAFAAGSYTITPRWFRNSGTSTIIMDATDASLTVQLREVIEA